ncbi:PLP-dependent transferase [Oceaniferula flava]|uniref:PLP-dependent transferase n=1 Tax=Oceaniferula flava TaxID=2800421 RepID=UPI0028681F80|nr:PLP-dependent transferase [Oceaniferula flavus]
MKTEPAWREEDLGMPLPKTQHACSVCLPTWDSVLGYEEGREKVIQKLRSGYPRFFRHPAIARLFKEATLALTENGSKAVVFPNKDTAQRAQRFVEKRSGSASRIVSYEGLQALVVSEADFSVAMEYWRYTGEIVSSRQAERILQGRTPSEFNPKKLLRKLAGHAKCSDKHIYLYENGMAALFGVYRLISQLRPGKKSLQLEFPYVDAMRVQKHFGNGVVFLNEAEGESFEQALRRISKGEFSAVFCEAPSNPLLRTVDLETVSSACREGGVPLIVDDTICSAINIDVSRYADVVLSSLTKWVSGRGDVMAGQVRVCPRSPFASDLLEFLETDCPGHSRLFASDARVLARNVNSFARRMRECNRNGEAVADFLLAHPAVEKVWYPKFTTPELYQAVKRDDGGYGGLISFVLKNRKKSPRVFDALQLSKGPSLGTDFSLACPYTLLAHYDELEWAEGCGLDRNLIRLSVGREEQESLIEVIGKALEEA